ncbi:MAG: hypothetical protein ACLQVF_34440 [Isosphaeraceae bacterium]
MRLFLQFFSLSDRYEQRARLLPGLLLAAAPALTAGAVLQQFATWYAAASSAIGVEFLAAIVLGQFARARGRRVEEVLWKAWGGPPTTRWLRPWDHTCSDQQKVKWRGAINRLTGLSLPASVPDGGSQDDVDRLNADATRQLRYALRGKPEAAMLATHNEEYGFARNLSAVRWYWVALSLTCLVGCGVAFAFGMRPYLGLAIAGAFSVASIFIARELPDYVKRCADRYAESLFATAILVSQAMDDSAKQPKRKTANKSS